MTKRQIVLATLGSLGDVHPFLALADELQRRGHAMVIATNTIHRERIESAGHRFARMRPEVPTDDPEVYRKLFDEHSGHKYAFRQILSPALRESYCDLLEATQQADLLISTPLSLAAPLVAQQRRMVWVSAQLQPVGFLSQFDPPIPAALMPLGRIPWFRRYAGATTCAIARFVTKPWVREVFTLRAELGLPPGGHPMWEGQQSPYLALGLFSPHFAPKRPDWPRAAQTTGFCFYDKPDSGRGMPAGLAQFLDSGPPPVIFTLGSAMIYVAKKFYAHSLAAVKKMGIRAVFLVGNTQNQATLAGPLPPNVFVADYAPYAEVFARAKAVVHQGGIGTLSQVIRAGVPMVIVPFGYDQHDNAARSERLGIAKTIARTRYSPSAIETALNALDGDASFSQHVTLLQRKICCENGIASAAQAIEQVFH